MVEKSSGTLVRGNNVLNLTDLVARYWRRRWLIASSASLVAVAFGLAALLMRPLYEAKALLAPVTAEQGLGALSSAIGQLGGLASLVGVEVGNGDARTDEAIAVLRSRKFTRAFIEEKGLLGALYSEKFDVSKGTWKVSVRRPPTIGRAYELFDRKVRFVSRDKKTGLVLLVIQWRDRELAASWTNALVDRLNEEMRVRAIADATASISYLQRELDSTVHVDTRQAINRLVEAKIQQRMMASVTKEYAFRVVDPAAVPDADRPLRPRKTLMLIGGFAVGVLLALGVIPIIDNWGLRRADSGRVR